MKPKRTFVKLKTELYRQQIAIKDLAKPLNISETTVYARFQGRSPWKLNEMYYIMKLLRLPDKELSSYFPRYPYEVIENAS